MTANHENEPRGRRFKIEDVRARAREAMAKSESILSRAYGLFRDPKKEWEQIKAEETTVPNILLGYVAPLAAIPPVCDLIGSAVFNRLLQTQPADAVVRAFVYWVVSVGLVFLLGFVINALADNFDGDSHDLSAHKVAAYSLTPSFLSGFFSLWPPLWWLSLIALAAMVFLMYRGLPILMKAPEDRALSYAATVTAAAVVGFIVLFALASAVT